MQINRKVQAQKHPPKSCLPTKQKPDLRPKTRQRSQPGIFGGLSFFIDAGPNTRDIRKIAQRHGATILLSFSDETDFVITEIGRPDLIRTANRYGLCCVCSKWILDCVAHNSLLIVSPYSLQIQFGSVNPNLRLFNRQEKRLSPEIKSKALQNQSSRKISKINPLAGFSQLSQKQPASPHKSFSPRLPLPQMCSPISSYNKIDRESKGSTLSPASQNRSRAQSPVKYHSIVDCMIGMESEKMAELIEDLEKFSKEGFLFENDLPIESFNFDELNNGHLSTQATYSRRLKKKTEAESSDTYTLVQRLVVPKRRYTLDKVDETDPLKYLKYVQKKIKGALRK